MVAKESFPVIVKHGWRPYLLFDFFTIIDLLLRSGHPFHLSPMPLRAVSQVPSLMELDHLGDCQSPRELPQLVCCRIAHPSP